MDDATINTRVAILESKMQDLANMQGDMSATMKIIVTEVTEIRTKMSMLAWMVPLAMTLAQVVIALVPLIFR